MPVIVLMAGLSEKVMAKYYGFRVIFQVLDAVYGTKAVRHHPTTTTTGHVGWSVGVRPVTLSASQSAALLPSVSVQPSPQSVSILLSCQFRLPPYRSLGKA